MFLKTVRRQGEAIFRLENANKQLQENIDELKTEKEQLKVYFNDCADDITLALKNIQTINRMGISQYEKNKRINALIFEIDKWLLKIRLK